MMFTLVYARIKARANHALERLCCLLLSVVRDKVLLCVIGGGGDYKGPFVKSVYLTFEHFGSHSLSIPRKNQGKLL